MLSSWGAARLEGQRRNCSQRREKGCNRQWEWSGAWRGAVAGAVGAKAAALLLFIRISPLALLQSRLAQGRSGVNDSARRKRGELPTGLVVRPASWGERTVRGAPVCFVLQASHPLGGVQMRLTYYIPIPAEWSLNKRLMEDERRYRNFQRFFLKRASHSATSSGESPFSLAA